MSRAEEKVLRLLGLATRAGKLTPGLDATLAGIEKGEVFLAIVTHDAGESTAKKLVTKAKSKGCSMVRFSDSETLGSWTGGKKRAVTGVLDKGFAEGILQALSPETESTENLYNNKAKH